MAINTNALTLGASAPAKSSFQSRAGGSGAVANDQNPDADSGAPSSASAAAAPDSGDSPSQPATTAQKSAGPSAQTRANARTPRAPAAATAGAAASTASAADAADVAQEAAADFGSAMASALERSAATSSAEPAAATKPATNTPDPTTPAQSTASASADAVAWIAQVLMPHAVTTPAAAATSASTAAADSPGAAVTSITAGAAGVPGVVANASSGATQTVSTALRRQIDAQIAGDNSIQTAAAPTADAQAQASQGSQAATATATLGTVNAMADVQKLISGMTAGAATAHEAGDDDGTPVTHAAATTAGTDGSQAAAAVQAAGLGRGSGSLGSATLSIQAPVGSTAFADEVSARVTGLAQSGITQAQLQLSPADLGPVQVHITLQSGQASVWFGANHADTRAALEQSLPRLRELFAGAGMPLTDSGVFREPPQPQSNQSLPAAGSARGNDGDTGSASTVTQVSNIRLSLLDTYA